MAEVVQSIVVTVEVESNKRTMAVSQEADSMEAVPDVAREIVANMTGRG